MALNATAIGMSWNIYVLNVWYNRNRKIFIQIKVLNRQMDLPMVWNAFPADQEPEIQK